MMSIAARRSGTDSRWYHGMARRGFTSLQSRSSIAPHTMTCAEMMAHARKLTIDEAGITPQGH